MAWRRRPRPWCRRTAAFGIEFTPRPAGTRWYHSHVMAGADLHRGTYTGQFGFLMIEPGNSPGNYDKEVFLALRDWEPFFKPEEEDDDDTSNSGPQPERPKTLDTSPSGLEVGYQMFSINDKSLGAGRTDPRAAGRPCLDASAERQRQHEPENRLAGPPFSNRGHGRQSRAHAAIRWM